jgi:hypothetical protein
MTDHDDLRWLAAEQPLVTPPDPSATARARDAFLAHASAADRAQPVHSMPAMATRPRAQRAWLRPARVLALAAVGVLAAAATVGLPRLGGGGGTLAVPEASAAPLAQLSQQVLAEPAPTGDATLVLRRHAFADDEGFTGADLFLDDGRYFYAPTRGEIPARIASGSTESPTSARVVRAVAAAASTDLPIQEARAGVIRASFPPGAEIAPADQPGPVAVPGASRAPAAPAPVPVPRRSHATGGAPAPAAAPRTSRQVDDNRIWFSSIDALQAGAGRRDVRAGALRLMASIAAVDVTKKTVAGHPALRVRSTDFAGGYEERLLIDATTGVPLRFEGGTTGKPPSVTVTYDVSRVTTAEVASG